MAMLFTQAALRLASNAGWPCCRRSLVTPIWLVCSWLRSQSHHWPKYGPLQLDVLEPLERSMTTQPHAIDLQLIKRLTELSRRGYYDPYQRFYWPEQIDKECLWCDEDLLTTYGTELHSSLSQQTLAALSQSEAINFYSLNVHGIKGALEFIMRCIYDARYRDISEYLHLFITEENTHMWFFAKFCIDYYGKIYPAATMPESRVSNPIEKDLYMFASTLIFEEYVDFYNHKVGRNIQVPAIVREINHQHHVDESRHVSFGREVVKSIYGELAAADDSGDVTTRVG